MGGKSESGRSPRLFGGAKNCSLCRGKARAAWNPKRYQSFNAELQIHAAEVELSLEAIERITVEDIEAGLFPERSEALDKQLIDFIPFLESCEEDVGGHGIVYR